MSKKFAAIAAIAAIVFDLIACIGDSNQEFHNKYHKSKDFG